MGQKRRRKLHDLSTIYESGWARLHDLATIPGGFLAREGIWIEPYLTPDEEMSEADLLDLLLEIDDGSSQSLN
jgi:hypothetical protein